MVKRTSQNLVEYGEQEQVVDPEQAAKIAVQEYDPSEDPRLWRAMTGMWRSVCSEFADIASGYASDGRSCSDLASRLQKELLDRIAQESNTAGEFREEFRKTAFEWLERRRSDVVTADMNAQLQELDRERQAAAERARQQDQRNREAKAAELERQAAALRQGPQSRTTSYLAR
jgi:hypothetical protein